MKQQFQHCFRWIALLLVSVLIGTGCTGPGSVEPASTPVSTPSPGVVVTPTSVPTATPDAVVTPTLAPTPAQEPEAHEDVLYADAFNDPASGWLNELAFDNYYIGYHEPEWYHVEVHEQNDSEVVVLPGRTFDDFTVESEILVSGANTAPDGDFRYGLVIRRTGNRFYAFTISPRTKTWYVLKSSPTGLEVLDEGADNSIQGLTDLDTLRVDAKGPALTFHINGQPVSRISDSDYAGGEVGFFVETSDSPRAHIHYDSLTIRGVEVLSLPPQDVLYADEFKDPASGWLNELAFDNYYIGYHEPEWYHVEVHERGDRAVVVLPGQSFDDFTVETATFVSGANTAPDGDFRYGLAVRRSGNRFYAFTISPRTKTWYVLKSSPTGPEVLDEGTDDSIQGLTDLDTLRVDAKGPALTFHINGQPVSQVSDSDYASGEVGFFVETFDSPRVHVHYDSLTIRETPEPASGQSNSTPTAAKLTPTTVASAHISEPAAGTVRTMAGLEMVYVPAGLFEMGSDPQKDEDTDANEMPMHTVTLDGFWIGKTEVTNTQYRPFIEAGGYQKEELWTEAGWEWRESENVTQPLCWDAEELKQPNQPVACVSWYEAVAYTRWLAQVTGQFIQLPSEAEWEKAARGIDGRIYPWGNDVPKGDLLNFNNGVGATTEVGSYPAGASPYGVVDMAGNAVEWTRSIWGKGLEEPDFEYPYDPADGRENLDAPDDVYRVVRGGSLTGFQQYVRLTFRYGVSPDDQYDYYGIRVVVSPSSP